MTSFAAIGKRYLRGWFVIDAIAAIPFDIFVSGGGGGGANFAKMLKLPRMMRAMRVLRFAKALPFAREVLSMVGLFQIVFVLLLLAHWAAGWCASARSR